jgi:NAD(P)-dependent dehydrogenase (short-subunit alcohol dehydrogenase family)
MKNNGGSIINIGSYMGVLGLNPSNYAGTGLQTDSPTLPSPIYHYEKGGMLNFTRWAASVLGKFNIRVNCIILIGLFEDNDTQLARQHAANTLLGRCSNYDDLKGGVVYLASQASAFVTGTSLTIDGGYTAI